MHRESLHKAYDALQKFCPHRRKEVFTEFLPEGHQLMTISCVPLEQRETVIFVKSLLGMHITLYDDLADNPQLANEQLLVELYKIPFSTDSIVTHHLSSPERETVSYAITACQQIFNQLVQWPNYSCYQNIFRFDFFQFYSSNQFYALVLQNRHLLNSIEIRHFGPFNMGMVIAGMIDIIASPHFIAEELGKARMLFMLCQRFGHISNSLTTLERELSENTVSNEILVIADEIGDDSMSASALARARNILAKEQDSLLARLNFLVQNIKSFDALSYVTNLRRLHHLHERFQGII